MRSRILLIGIVAGLAGASPACAEEPVSAEEPASAEEPGSAEEACDAACVARKAQDPLANVRAIMTDYAITFGRHCQSKLA